MTQGEFAEWLRAEQTTVSSWERGRTEPSGPALIALCALLQLDPEAILHGTGFSIPDFHPPIPATLHDLDFYKDGKDGEKIKLTRIQVPRVVDHAKKLIRNFEAAEAEGLVRAAMKNGHRVWLIIES